MEEDNVLISAEKRKSDKAELNENGCTKKICQDAVEESLAEADSVVAKSSTPDSSEKKASADTSSPPNELVIMSGLNTGVKGSNCNSSEKTVMKDVDVTVSDSVSKVFVENLNVSESTLLSEVNVTNEEKEILIKDTKESKSKGTENLINDTKEGKSEDTVNFSEPIKKAEVNNSLSTTAHDDSSEHVKKDEIKLCTSSTDIQKECDSSELQVSGEKISSESSVADVKEHDLAKKANNITLPKNQDRSISDSALCSNSVNETLDTSEATNKLTIKTNTDSDKNIVHCVSEKPLAEDLIVKDKLTTLLDTTKLSTISAENESKSVLKSSDYVEPDDGNNLVSITDTPIIQDTITEPTDGIQIVPEATAKNDPILCANNISLDADTNYALPTSTDGAAVSFSSALNETNDAITIQKNVIATTPTIDNTISAVEDKVNQNLKDNLTLSENAQSPSFVSSKEMSEHEPINDGISKIPTLAESLKQAVSANSSCNDTFSIQVPISNSEMLDVIKKNEPSPMEVDTPSESLIDTPCESGETTPSTSTPADSCQVSAAPSPLNKDDSTVVIPDNEDESSKDTKLHDDEILNTKEEEIEDIITLRRRPKKGASKAKKMPTRSTKQKGPLVLDEDTRMSATGNDKSSLIEFPPDEDSQSSVSTSLTSSKKKVRSFRSEVIVPESTEVFTADKVVEYIWPLDGNGEHFFIQEHVAQYLGVTSFKRKYRDLRRRQIESTEKEYLKDMGLVTEMACDLGLTAVRSEDMLDILFNDFPSKYEELQKLWRERDEKKLLTEKGKVDYQVANLDKSKMQEYSRKAALNASKWNAVFMREKREERRYSFDLQTFTVHYPLKASKPSPQDPKIGSYPIAVLPGQYTDYCRSYTSKDLKSMPLQTVLTGPYTAEELAAETFSAESDEESAPASVCTSVDIKEEILPVVELESTVATVPASIDPLSAEKQPRCKACNGGRDRNKEGKPEPLVICGTCRIASHPTCIDLPLTMIEKIEMYSWQCMECKTCAQCNDPDDEEKMIFCDMCDRGYHIYCVGLRKVPNGRWHCKECAICSSCGCKTPSGNEHIKNADWQHEFKKDKDKQLKYICTLCVPCDKYWKRRQYCTVCLKVYRSIPDDGMVRCAGCPKYIHKDGCSLLVDNERHCTICYGSRNKTALNHSRIIAAAKKKMASSY